PAARQRGRSRRSHRYSLARSLTRKALRWPYGSAPHRPVQRVESRRKTTCDCERSGRCRLQRAPSPDRDGQSIPSSTKLNVVDPQLKFADIDSADEHADDVPPLEPKLSKLGRDRGPPLL